MPIVRVPRLLRAGAGGEGVSRLSQRLWTRAPVIIGGGTIKVQAPRVRDLPPEQEPFESQILKPYQKRSQKLAELFPKLFVEGLATRDFEPALRCLLGSVVAVDYCLLLFIL